MDKDKENSNSEPSSYAEEVPTLEAAEPVSYWKLFSFCTPCEWCWLALGFIMSAIKALQLPIVVIVYSEFTALLVDRTLRITTSSTTYFLPLFDGGKILTNASKEENMQELYKDSISYGILLSIASLILFISGIFSVDVFNAVALRAITRLRMQLFAAVIRQDIGWHDLATKQNFILSMSDDIEKIRDGMSEKVGHFLYLLMGFIVTVGISFSYGWKLTLAVSVYIPIVIVLNIIVSKFQTKLSAREGESYAGAGNLVEEVISSIRTVISYGGEEKEAQRYDEFLVPARKASQRKGAFSGLSDGVLKSMLFLSCAGAFWYGVNLILADRNEVDKEYTPAILMIAFFGIIVGADNIARTSPFLEAFATARGSAANIIKVLDTPSKIDPLSEDGRILNNGLKGDIEFVDVFFRYPSRPDIMVHRGLSFKVKAGQTVALVGFSGCGKSTCIQLLQRFYDPIFGLITLDDLNIRKFNLQWLRSNVAVVGQEPVLFQGTIGENISYGKPNATYKEIEEAARAAGVHDFIISLPESYCTHIGELGSSLSGGQKQRIAIARALIQNPKILLLDEATSALDYHSEKLVQAALDHASKGRTTIVVSHRLSAVRNADKIVFLHEGKVAEEGTHEELMQMGGRYSEMVRAGEIVVPETEEENMEDIDDLKRKSLVSIDLPNVEKNLKNSVQFTEPSKLKIKNNKKHIKNTNKQQEEEEIGDMFQSCRRILALARPEAGILILGSIIAILFGFTYPLFSVAFGEFYGALAEPDEEEALNRTSILSIFCLVLGVLTGICCFLQTYLFNYASVCLTTRMRSLVFRSILRQHIGFFDDEKNSVGALSTRLAVDAAGIQGAIGYPLSGIIQAISNFIISISLSLYYSWKLALLCMASCPFIVGSVIFEAKFMGATMLHEKEAMEEAGRIASEAISNVRTVAGLRMENYIINKYNEQCKQMEKLIHDKIKYRGVINSAGQAFLFFAYAVALCYGGVLVSEEKVAFQDIIKVSETLLYGSMMLAQSLAFAPAFTAAIVSGQRLFQLLDKKPLITSCTEEPKNTLAKQLNLFEGVRFHELEFRYPTRPENKILNGLNLDVLQGKTVALVGHSGCGKSTCIQLLLRFYDPEAGKIFIDHNEIVTDFSLEYLRGQLGFVQQEPRLFARTIAENIAYGDNSRNINMAEIIEAAKQANAHAFITALSNGYNTKMGARGTQLSGGQKQRIAIARALIRNPKILLLDEATSALDLQSEQIVSQALDVARTGRTCILIAHRLSTIQNADLICVIQNGQVVEQGKHHQLINKNGLYAKLHRSQTTA